MKHLPALDLEAAASTHIHQLLGAAAPTSTNLSMRETRQKLNKASQDDASKKDPT
jgi:hypothetical protein